MFNQFEIAQEDGGRLYCCSWIPNDPRRVVIIVHGLGEHSGRYSKVAYKLNEAEAAVFSFDLRGHGKSSGPRGHIESFRTIFSDIDTVADRCRDLIGGLPVFIYGHSLGGGIALAKRRFDTRPYAGYIVTSPWLTLVHPPSALLAGASKVLASVIPSLSVPSNLDTSQLSTDARIEEAYIKDPLVHGKISLATVTEGLKYGKLLLDAPAVPGPPLFLAHGRQDGICSLEASRAINAKDPLAVKYLELDGRHELHNEPACFDILMEAITDFIVAHS